MSMLRFDDRVAVITGAGHGLGRSYALLLAARGASVVVNDLGGSIDGGPGDTGPAPAQQVVEEIRRAGGAAVTSGHDIGTEDGARACVQLALDTYGRVDIVVNNAGINPAAPFADTPREMFQRVLAVHLLGTWSVTQAAWPSFVAQQYGRVVNTSSGAMYQGHGVRSTYAAAKAAVYGLSRDLAVEGRDDGILVNALCPGALTRMVPRVNAELVARMQAWTPDAVAHVVAVLAHEDCTVTGEMLEARGGEINGLYMAMTAGVHLDAGTLTPELVRDQLDAILHVADPGTVGPLVDLRGGHRTLLR